MKTRLNKFEIGLEVWGIAGLSATRNGKRVHCYYKILNGKISSFEVLEGNAVIYNINTNDGNQRLYEKNIYTSYQEAFGKLAISKTEVIMKEAKKRHEGESVSFSPSVFEMREIFNIHVGGK